MAKLFKARTQQRGCWDKRRDTLNAWCEGNSWKLPECVFLHVVCNSAYAPSVCLPPAAGGGANGAHPVASSLNPIALALEP